MPNQTIEPIYVDRNFTPKDYQPYQDRGTLLVTDVFPTLQGEGPFMGRRSAFVRLAGCNFGGKGVTGPGCRFCDSRFLFFEGEEYSPAALAHKVKDVHPGFCEGEKLVVVTGGEPMLQRNLVSFIKELKSPSNPFGVSGHYGLLTEWEEPEWLVQIETNGVYMVEGLPNDVYVVVSPKAPENHKTGKGKYAKLPTPAFNRADCLKVLVSADPDSPYHVLPDFAYDFHQTGKPVYLSPINVYKKTPVIGEENIFDDQVYDVEANKLNHEYAAELCMESGFLLNVQSHLLCSLP